MTKNHTSGGSMDDTIVIDGGNDFTIDIGNYGTAQSSYVIGASDTITLDPNIYSTVGSGASQTLTWSQDYSINSWNSNYENASVKITTDGVEVKEGGDIKIGGKSLTEAIAAIEDRLAILKPNPELEDRWEQLKDLRRQYELLEKDLLEKEKIMKILKES